VLVSSQPVTAPATRFAIFLVATLNPSDHSLRAARGLCAHLAVGLPPENYDRLLDFTHPVTGTNFFAPSASFLEGIASSG